MIGKLIVFPEYEDFVKNGKIYEFCGGGLLYYFGISHEKIVIEGLEGIIYRDFITYENYTFAVNICEKLIRGEEV